MMDPYSVLFMCKGVLYNSRLHEESLFFTVNGVKIEVEVDGSLYIEDPSGYTKEQLQILAYRKQEGSNTLFLTKYVFQYALPAKLFDKDNHRVVSTVMTGSIANSDSSNYTWSIMDAHSSTSDVVSAIIELEEKREYECLGTVGKTDWGFFSDAQNTEPTRPLYWCEDFSQRICSH